MLPRSRERLASRARRGLWLALAVLVSASASLAPACGGRDADANGSPDGRAAAPRSSEDLGQEATPRDEPLAPARAERTDTTRGSSPSPSLARRRREAREDGVQAAGEWISDLARQ